VQYLVLAYEHDGAFGDRDDPEAAPGYWSSWSGYIAALAESGVLVSAAGLQPPASATTVRRRDGKRTVHDGPFADSKEHLGGYFLIEVPTLDDALAWAERCPSAEYASVEVRPVLPPMAG
jgi:hypothetical protein